MKACLIWMIIIFQFVTTISHAQEKLPEEQDTQALADELISTKADETTNEETYEALALSFSNPLNLNTATIEQLRNLFILRESQIQQFIAYRAETGLLHSIYELQTIPEFDIETIRKLAPLVEIFDPFQNSLRNLLNQILTNKNSYLLISNGRLMQPKTGYQRSDSLSSFLGNPDQLQLRLRSSKTNYYSLGFTAEKDSGEKINWGKADPYSGTDFTSFHLQLQNRRKLKNIILGDYQLQCGQGLALGGLFSTGKGGETINTVRRNNLLAMPYTSTNENNNLRGIVTTIQLTKNTIFTTFISSKYRDGSIQKDTSDFSGNTFINTGLHRNNNELKSRKNLNEKQCGGIFQFQHGAIDAGVLYTAYYFNKSITPGMSLYNQFAFSGDRNTILSMYGNYSLYNFTFFSEYARNMPGGSALVLGTIGSFSKHFDMAILFRNYSRDYSSLYSNAFRESSRTQNERGVYWGLKYLFNTRIQLSSYLDIFENPWIAFQNYKPSQGYEWLFRMQYQPRKTIILSAQARETSKSENSPLNSHQYQTEIHIKRSFTLNAEYEINSYLKMRSRVQWSSYTFVQSKTKGIAAYQDLTYTLRKLKISARYGLFDTDDYENRQYAAERDVWLAYSLPAYYGQGVQKMIMLQYKISKKLNVWIRYKHLRLEQVESIGTNLDAIQGNEKDEVKIQLRVQL